MCAHSNSSVYRLVKNRGGRGGGGGTSWHCVCRKHARVCEHWDTWRWWWDKDGGWVTACTHTHDMNDDELLQSCTTRLSVQYSWQITMLTAFTLDYSFYVSTFMICECTLLSKDNPPSIRRITALKLKSLLWLTAHYQCSVFAGQSRSQHSHARPPIVLPTNREKVWTAQCVQVSL